MIFLYSNAISLHITKLIIVKYYNKPQQEIWHLCCHCMKAEEKCFCCFFVTSVFSECNETQCFPMPFLHCIVLSHIIFIWNGMCIPFAILKPERISMSMISWHATNCTQHSQSYPSINQQPVGTYDGDLPIKKYNDEQMNGLVGYIDFIFCSNFLLSI